MVCHGNALFFAEFHLVADTMLFIENFVWTILFNQKFLYTAHTRKRFAYFRVSSMPKRR